MSDLLRRLREQRSTLHAEADAFLADVERRAGDLSGADGTRWSNYTGQLDQLNSRIGELEAHEARDRRADEVRRQYGSALSAARPEGGVTGDETWDALLAGDVRSADLDLSAERRALVVGTPTAGGDVVPTSFRGQLVEHMVQAAGMRRTGATVLSTRSGEDLQVPKTTAHGTAGIVAEGQTIPASDPAFSQVTLGAYKYGFTTQASSELVADSGVDLTGYLARMAGRAIGNASGADYVAGSGSGEPAGAVGAASTGTTGGDGIAGAFSAEDLIDLSHSVIPEYRANAVWLMSDEAAAAARKLREDSGAGSGTGGFLWQSGLVEGTPDRLLGRPVVIDPNVPTPAAGAKSILFGDFSAYVIRDVASIRVERSDDYAFTDDLVTWRFLFRTDGALVDTSGAVKCFVGGAA